MSGGWSQTLLSGAQQQDKGQWAQTEAQEVWTWGRTSSLWGWRSPGTGCPGRLWSLLLWRYSRPTWTLSCAACCRWPFFVRGVGLDDPQRSLPILAILWFCDLCSTTQVRSSAKRRWEALQRCEQCCPELLYLRGTEQGAVHVSSSSWINNITAGLLAKTTQD